MYRKVNYARHVSTSINIDTHVYIYTYTLVHMYWGCKARFGTNMLYTAVRI